MWYVGIDWADTKHDIVVIDDTGRRVAQLRIEHNAAGVNKLVHFLHELGPVEQMACIIAHLGTGCS